MKLKKLLVSLAIATASVSSFALSDGEAGILGIIIGSQMHQDRQQAPVYQQPMVQPQIIYQEAPMIIQRHQREDYFGYCPYRGDTYYRCVETIRHNRAEEAYRRELNR